MKRICGSFVGDLAALGFYPDDERRAAEST